MPGGFLQAARNGKELQSADVNRNSEVCWALWIDFLQGPYFYVWREEERECGKESNTEPDRLITDKLFCLI